MSVCLIAGATNSCSWVAAAVSTTCAGLMLASWSWEQAPLYMGHGRLAHHRVDGQDAQQEAHLCVAALQGHHSWHSSDKQDLRGKAHVVQPPGGACSCRSACSLPADEEGHEEAVVLLSYAGTHHIAVVVEPLLHGHQSARGATSPSCICYYAKGRARCLMPEHTALLLQASEASVPVTDHLLLLYMVLNATPTCLPNSEKPWPLRSA